MRSCKRLSLVAAVLLLVPTAAFASRGWTVDARAGVGLPTGDFGDAFKSGLLIGVEVSKMMSPQFAIGVDGNYLKNDPSDDYQASVNFFYGPGTDAEAKFVHYGVHGKLMLSASSDSKVTPYVIGGVGLYNAKFEITPSGGPDISDSDTRFGVRGGLGANFMVGNTWGIGVQVDYNDLFFNNRGYQTSGAAVKVDYVGISGGLHFVLSPSSSK
jgi:opacity protein-like surface antigen